MSTTLDSQARMYHPTKKVVYVSVSIWRTNLVLYLGPVVHVLHELDLGHPLLSANLGRPRPLVGFLLG